MLILPWLVNWADHVPPALRPMLIKRLRKWYILYSSIGMFVTFILGFALASLGNWYASSWLSYKLIVVIVFAALHGLLSGQLGRLAIEPSYRCPRWITKLTWVNVPIILSVVYLVVFKP
ncbi:CopD family protein [Ningiella sp. W23]|uniref:CopD family protein n=1 Tax=Ningiella sp. W23 TaxID=3023715 RepID=UPI0037571AE8